MPILATSNIIKKLSPRVAIYTVLERYKIQDGQFVGLLDIRYADRSYNLFEAYDKIRIDESNYPVMYSIF